jgi:hypothetical protein
VTQVGSPATESDPGDNGRQAVRGSRLARRRRALFWVAGGAALLAIGGLIGSSFVKSPQQIGADTAAPPPTATTAKVVSQVVTSSVQMRGVVYPGTPVRRVPVCSGNGYGNIGDRFHGRRFAHWWRLAGGRVHLEAGRGVRSGDLQR